MNEIDARPMLLPIRSGRAASALAAGIVALSVVVLTLVVAPVPRSQGAAMPEPSAETFTAMGALGASSPAAATAASPAAPSLSATPVASASPLVDSNHVATRIRVPDLHIDLAVVAPPRDRNAFPKCGVAMYLAELHQPGQNDATYLSAHARAGMFLPIYERAIPRLHGGPRSMLGLSVEVFTSDNLVFRYEVVEVLLHQTTLGKAARAETEELWLQTSEGPMGTRGKTQLRALPVGVETATERDAHPAANPVTSE